MKNIYFLILLLTSVQFCFSQFYISASNEVYVSSNDTLYSNESIENNGTITLKNNSYLIFDADFINNQEVVYNDVSDKAVLQIGSGEASSNQPQDIQFHPINSEEAPLIVLNKLSETATISRGHMKVTENFVSINGTLDAGSYINASDVPTDPGKVFGLTFINPDATTVAVVGESINGEVRDILIERFIPAGDNNTRAYRLLTSAVNSTGSINANWQEAAVTTAVGNGNPNPGYGIHITGGLTADGFDQSGTGNPSMFIFDNSNGNNTADQNDDWSSLANTNLKTLKAGEAYLTFVRGDRSIDLTVNSPTPNNTTLRSIGDLHIGTKIFSSANNGTEPEYILSDQADFYSLLGNPYQAIVDFRDLDLVNVNSNFHWVWDPNVGVRGNYVTLDFTDSNPDVVTNNNVNSQANQYIQPGQSFFVQTIVDDETTSLTFNEDDKDTSGGTTMVFSEQSNPAISLLLYSTDAFTSGNRESDGLFLKFNSSNNNDIDLMDADKFFGSDENLARLHGNDYLSIENRAMPVDAEVLALFTTGYIEDQYTFVANAFNVQNNFEAYLLDNYTGTQTQLNEGATQVNYSVDANIPESVASDRFSVIFGNTTLGIEDNSFGEGFSLYPNPTNDGRFSIKTPDLSGEVTIKLTNMLGQQVKNEILSIVGNEVIVDANALSTGVYVVELSQDKNTFSSKLIVE